MFSVLQKFAVSLSENTGVNADVAFFATCITASLLALVCLCAITLSAILIVHVIISTPTAFMRILSGENNETETGIRIISVEEYEEQKVNERVKK